MEKAVTMVRIYLREGDRGHRKLLLDEIMDVLRDGHCVRGATVLRGSKGFGHGGEIHSASLLHLRSSLPLVVEFCDEPAIIDAPIAALGELVPPGCLIQWPVCTTPVASDE